MTYRPVYFAGVDSQLLARFEAKVDRSGEHHLWTGAHKADGTGMFKVAGGTPVNARKVAWELVHGPVPSGGRVISCGVKSCVRVEHLRLEERSSRPPTPRRTARTRVQV